VLEDLREALLERPQLLAQSTVLCLGVRRVGAQRRDAHLAAGDC
jgi:hypothetical protein